MATPSFGTYYLAQTVTSASMPVSQILAAAPAPATAAPPAVSADSRPSDRSRSTSLSDLQRRTTHCLFSIIAGIFFGGFGAGLLVCGIACAQQHFVLVVLSVTPIFSFLVSKVCCATASPALRPENNVATAAWSKQQSLEMQPQAHSREATFGQLSLFSLTFGSLACTLNYAVADKSLGQHSPSPGRSQTADINLSSASSGTYLKPRCSLDRPCLCTISITQSAIALLRVHLRV
jgi:hypothetical protein